MNANRRLRLPAPGAEASRSKGFAILCLAIALNLCALAAVDASPKHLVTLEDLQRFQDENPGDVTLQLSPDGERLAVVKNNELLVVSVPGGEVLKNLGEAAVPGWSRSGKQLAFYSLRSGALQLWVWDTKGDQLRQITDLNGGVVVDLVTRGTGIRADALRFSWSPDESRVVFGLLVGVPRAPADKSATRQNEAAERPNAPRVFTSRSPLAAAWRGVYAHDETVQGVAEIKDGRTLSFTLRDDESLHTQLMIADVRTGRVSQLTGGDRSWFNPAWSPDGATIACATSTSETLDVNSSSDIVFIDVASGKTRAGPSGAGFRFRPLWSPDGTRLAFLGEKWLLDWPRIYLLEVAGSAPREVPFIDRYISGYQWDHDGSGFLIAYRDGPSTRLGHADLRLPGVREITVRSTLPLSVREFSQSATGAIVWNQFDPQDLSTVKYTLGTSAGVPQAASINLIRLSRGVDGLLLGKVQVIVWRNRHGERLRGSLLLPPGFHEGERLPLIVDSYPHTQGSDWTQPMSGNFAWSAAGYAVFRPSPPTVHSRKIPWETHASSLVAMGAAGIDLMVDDVLSGVDELVRRRTVDPDRMCLYGFSAGGAVVSDLVTRTHRFKCAVAVAPAGTDWVSPLLSNPQFVMKGDWAGGLQLERDINQFVAMSSVFHVADVQTPMLLADGDNTPDFLLWTLELYKALRTHNKEVTLIRYPDQGHGFTGDAMKDFWDRELSFFGKYLRPEARH